VRDVSADAREAPLGARGRPALKLRVATNRAGGNVTAVAERTLARLRLGDEAFNKSPRRCRLKR
jgi:hypothetical protein